MITKICNKCKIEKTLVDIGPTDHLFIENIEIIGGTLNIQTGS